MCVSACGKHRESRGRHPESSTRLRRFRHGSHYMGAVHGTGHAVTVFSTDHGCTAPPLTGPWTVPTRVSPPSAAPPTNRNRDANRPHRNHPTGSAPTLQALASESHTEIFSSIFSTFLLFSLSLSLSLISSLNSRVSRPFPFLPSVASLRPSVRRHQPPPSRPPPGSVPPRLRPPRSR
jgi:hypothetical protein